MLRRELLSRRPLAKKKKTMSNFWTNLGNGILNSTANSLSGGLSSAVSGLVNGAIGAIFRPSLSQQINAQKELMQEQARINKDQYDYQYDKTSPETMVQLYRNAGLNPGLMYSGNAGSGLRASMGSSSIGSLSPYNGTVYTDPTMSSTIANIDADTKLKENQSSMVEEQTITERLKQVSEQISQLLKQEQTEEVKQRIKTLEAEEKSLIAQTTTENELRLPRRELMESESALNNARKTTENALLDGRVKKLSSDIKNIDANTAMREFHNWYESVNHTTMTNGMNAVVDRVANLFWSRGFQNNIQHTEHGEVNLVTQIQSLFNEVGSFLSQDMRLTLANWLAKWLINATKP